MYDHRRHDRGYDEIERALADLRRVRIDKERAELARGLNRESIAFAVTMDMHVTKEDELLLPVLEEHFNHD